jgi:hypothetical protein
MPKYQLTLSPNYVPNWGINEALRELFQNAIDRENEDKEAKIIEYYDAPLRHLKLGNNNTKLTKRSLLLGETTKDGKSTIGKYGEGYKLAFLVLLRMGFRITVHNNNEIWIPKLVKSKVFDAELLEINVMKAQNKDTDLVCVIEGLGPEAYDKFKEKCLLFQNPEHIKTNLGRILVEPRFKGQVYCNGLFVCEMENMACGYDMKPEHIELNRDRNKVTEFNISWEISRMWSGVEGFSDKILKLKGSATRYRK